jgi:hypothetical protein
LADSRFILHLPKSRIGGPFTYKPPLDEHLEEKANLLTALEYWHSAYAHLFTSPGSKVDRCGASSLELQYITTYFITALIPAPSKPNPETKTFMPMFEQAVSLAESVLTTPGNGNGDRHIYKIEPQVICPLFAVARVCPQNTLRRKAIALLLAYPRRESLWDSEFAGKLAEWIMLLEEERFEGEYAPDNIRCVNVEVRQLNLPARKAQVSCVIPNLGSAGWDSKSSVIRW